MNDFYIGIFSPLPVAGYIGVNLSAREALEMMCDPHILSKKKLRQDTLVVAMHEAEDAYMGEDAKEEITLQTVEGVGCTLVGTGSFVGKLPSIQSFAMRIHQEVGGDYVTGDLSRVPPMSWCSWIDEASLEVISYIYLFRQMPPKPFVRMLIPAMKLVLDNLPDSEGIAQIALRSGLSCCRKNKISNRFEEFSGELEHRIKNDDIESNVYYIVHAASNAVKILYDVLNRTSSATDDQIYYFCKHFEEQLRIGKLFNRRQFFRQFVTHDATLVR